MAPMQVRTAPPEGGEEAASPRFRSGRPEWLRARPPARIQVCPPEWFVFGGRVERPGHGGVRSAPGGWRPALVRAEAKRPGGGPEPDTLPGDAPARWREAVEAAKAFIEEHLGEPLDVVRISREVNLSRPHFTRVFREVEGVAPWTYVTVRRVRRAAELLEEDRRLSDVALETGFADQSHFTRVFKRVTGRTPGEYRKCDPDVQDGEGRAA